MSEFLDSIIGEEEDTQKGKFLIFTIGNEDYGIEIKHVIEIIGIQAITPVPELPEYVKGVINLRGKIIPVMDVRLRFRKESRDYDDRTCIIVVEIKEIMVGLIIDRVSEVIDIREENVAPPPQLGNGFHHRYIKGIGKVGSSVKLLLAVERLLNDEELDGIQNPA